MQNFADSTLSPREKKCEAIWPGAYSLEVIVSEKERALTALLLTEITKYMCYPVANYSGIIEDGEVILDGIIYHEELQKQANKGALVIHHCISAFEHTVYMLERWGIISKLFNNYAFELKLDANEIPKLVHGCDNLNKYIFAYSIDIFFEIYLQSQFQVTVGKCSIAPNANKLIDAFLAAELIRYFDEELIWTSKIDPYFYRRHSPQACEEIGKPSRKMGAEEFFVSLKRTS